MTKSEVLKTLESRTTTREEGDHWLWTGARNSNGYGLIRFGGKLYKVHRVALWIFNDFDLNSKLVVRHECDIPNCWNPRHLDWGTQLDNIKDMVDRGRAKQWSANHGGAVVERNRTHCPKGHPLDGKRGNGKRYCLTCNRERYVKKGNGR